MKTTNTVTQARSQLDQLRELSTIVADTGDFQSMRAYQPQDATTNPSLILKAVQQSEYAPLVERVIHDHNRGPLTGTALVDTITDCILIAFGREILDIVPGRVSTETDARLSFDADGTIAKARDLIALYEKSGIDRERILIKIAATWEGIEAASILQREGIRCNLTLMFSLVQAVACADAGVTLISPFVGRIYDWFKKEMNRDFSGCEDPGVRSVADIYAYYKRFGYNTEVMGASFRNTGQIIELAGCDLLTISPDLLEELSKSGQNIEQKLSADVATATDIERITFNEKQFRYALNDDAMATEKTAEGIRKFSADMIKLEGLIRKKL